MANCRKCNNWISIHQNLYHDGLCVDHDELRIEYIIKRRDNNAC